MTAVSSHAPLGVISHDLLAAGRAAPQAIQACQQTRLASLLYTLAQGSSLYSRHLRDYLNLSVPLHGLPVMRKAELMARLDEWVTNLDITLDGLRASTAQPARFGEPYLGSYVVWESSGTSRQPAIIVQTPFLTEYLTNFSPKPLPTQLM